MNELSYKTLDFCNELFGSYFRIREIHWNTHKMAKHKLCDDVMDSIIEYVDKLSEGMIGLEQRPGFDILKPVIPTSVDLTEILKVLRNKAQYLEQSLSSNSDYVGMVNILDDLITDLNEYVYLSTFE